MKTFTKNIRVKNLFDLTTMKRASLCFMALFTFSFSFFPDFCNAQYIDLVNFSGAAGSYVGANPAGDLTLSTNGMLYGMTRTGGTLSNGNIFSYNPATNTFSSIISFTGTGGSYIGLNPMGDLTLTANGALYGMTAKGGTLGNGNIFSYNPNTDTYTNLVNFSGTSGLTMGFSPDGSLTQSPADFYGMTNEQGIGGNGNIFSLEITGAGYINLVNLSGTSGPNSGYRPYGSLILSTNGILYGMTSAGGTNGDGNIFSYNPTTFTFTDLVDFTGTSGSFIGLGPLGGLTLSTSGVLYGMTMAGGTNGDGNIFSYNLNTNTFTDLVDFSGTVGPHAGIAPMGSLTLSPGGVLYGMTAHGGTHSDGNIFSYNPATNTFIDLVDFTGTGGSYVGLSPAGSLTLSPGGILYGMTAGGGTNLAGNIFSYTLLTIASASQTGNISCYGESNGNATASASGGVSPYTYSWSNGSTSNQAGSTLSAGTYTVSVTDSIGSSVTAGVTITQPPPLAITIASATPSECSFTAGSVTSNAATGGTPPYTYSWSPTGGSNLTASNLTPNNYTITVTDSNNCSSSTSIQVFQGGLPVQLSIVSQTNIPCSGGTGSASVTDLNSSGDTYTWEPTGGSSNSASNLSAGTYTVLAENTSFCRGGITVTITQSPTLGVSIASVSNLSCNGGATGSVTAIVGNLFTQNFPYEAAVQHFAVPAGITTVSLTLSGAQGGGSTGGDGASFSGVCAVTPGDILSVVTGGVAPIYNSFWANGGGGASWVYDSNIVLYSPSGTTGLLAVAAGGGGSGYQGSSGAAGGIDLAGNLSTASSDGSLAGGTGGTGGTAGINSDGNGPGSGGAGWLSNGANVNNGSGQPATGGNDEANGFSQPGPVYSNGGGYGGGGASGYLAGAGGGGYNGGGGGVSPDASTGYGGGGGGSYLNGTVIGTPVATNTGNGSVTISYSNSTGTPPYTYSWSPNGGTNLTSSGLSAGTYTLTVTDNSGCSATATATITQPNSIVITISPVTKVSCNGGATGSVTAIVGNLFTQNFPYEAAVQHFAVPAGITTVSLTLSGAQGGGSTGGDGASFSGVCAVTPGDILSVVTGGVAPIYNSFWANGGGGASWVYDSNIVLYSPSGTTGLLAVAAGGGGSGYQGSSGAAGGIDLAGNSSTASSDGSLAGGTGGTGGTAGINSDGNGPGSGGAGWLNNGANVNNGSGQPATGGNDEANGFSQPGPVYSNGGGYGGGGASGYLAGAGGGGYNGGGGGVSPDASTGYGGGGGGSYLNGTVIGTPVATNTGNGSVTISYSGAVLAGNSPYTYSWSPVGGTNLTASGLSGGTYTLTVTDKNGCSASISATITQPGILTAATVIMDNVSCFSGTNGLAKAGVGGGTQPYTYSWSPNINSTYIANNLSAGTYTVNIVDFNGCTASATATVTQPASSLSETVSNITYPSCSVPTGSATIAVSGGSSPYTYIWNPNVGSTSTVSGLAVHDYVVEVKDAHGCATAVTFSISQPPILKDSIVKALTVGVECGLSNNGSATVGAKYGTSPYTYSWSPNTSSSATASGLSVGTYTVTVHDANNCSVTASATITQSSGLTLSTVITDNISCYESTNGQAKVGVTGGFVPYTYSWSPNSNSTYIANGLSVGTYTVSVTDKNGCAGSTAVTMTQPAPIRDSMASITNAECHGGVGTATFGVKGGTPPYTYTWNPNVSTTTTATGLAVRNYLVEVKDARGCNGTAITFNITQPTALSARTSSGSCSSGFGTASVQVSGGVSPYSYIWSPNVNSTSTSTGLSAGIYTITVIDNNSCSDLVTATITCPPEVLSPVGENTSGNACCNSSNENITLYPNPNSGQFTLELSVVSPDGFPGDGQSSEGNKESTVEIYNMLGQKISNEEMPGSSMQINISNQPSGVYLYRVIKTENGNLIGEGKIVIQK